ncbi:hypothetical protein LRS10_04735 [Phenylobacterium sp. J426]|uniref:hypothetical protein n=1 Tax=Phenylobacterium sp. J426 TaxID=2898439 RepID=UPI002151211B|nr:hypothetical protein [Phenylobacterium sp. J426]MCR5873549.1 hypothetical protein [Phenylobacterium sp. J426]
MIDAADVLRPFLWLAAIAFLVGFVSYVALGRPLDARTAATEAWTAQVSAPVSDEWNTPKHI